MVDIMVMVFFSILNMVGILLYATAGLYAMDVVFCKDNRRLKRILSRNICVWWGRMKQRLNIDQKYGGSLFVLFGSILAILLKLSELSDVLNYASYKVCLRVVISLILPTGIILLYRAMGYRNSLFP